MSTFVVVPLSSNLLKLAGILKDTESLDVEVVASTAKGTSIVIGEDIILLDRLEIFQNTMITVGKYTLTPDIEGQFILRSTSDVQETVTKTKVNTTRSSSTNSKLAPQ